MLDWLLKLQDYLPYPRLTLGALGLLLVIAIAVRLGRRTIEDAAAIRRHLGRPILRREEEQLDDQTAAQALEFGHIITTADGVSDEASELLQLQHNLGTVSRIASSCLAHADEQSAECLDRMFKALDGFGRSFVEEGRHTMEVFDEAFFGAMDGKAPPARGYTRKMTYYAGELVSIIYQLRNQMLVLTSAQQRFIAALNEDPPTPLIDALNGWNEWLVATYGGEKATDENARDIEPPSTG